MITLGYNSNLISKKSLLVTCDLCSYHICEEFVEAEFLPKSANNCIDICGECARRLGINYLLIIKNKKQSE